MKNNKFSIIHRLKSFVFAFNGLKILVKEEHNARLHLIATLFVVLASIFFKITAYEWIAVIFSIGLVFMAEIFNTAVENIADYLTTERNNKIKIIKDLAAAAVLMSAITALTVGIVIFIPKIIEKFISVN